MSETPTAENDALRCLMDRPHDPHTWDFGSGEMFACDGWPDDENDAAQDDAR